jgi:hypothetical protein
MGSRLPLHGFRPVLSPLTSPLCPRPSWPLSPSCCLREAWPLCPVARASWEGLGACGRVLPGQDSRKVWTHMGDLCL